ncbi:dihydrofolate reductase family protein [Streptomonospora sp. S1-112]|uniref:Dihydrofolate reductase family protein n=1 Tax=Streptomonospora mangrovi TaxID=2883123 RepID=A0A9X3NLF3_9ACTN|nr:dihydrofolate reductase family protein [Streptomonospora mangrovi]MDA0564196.1 dihydrofolate reductase family protein [Streptomonospora mangrovi]
MSKVVCDVAVSVDGYVAGPNQSRENPLGEGAGEDLHAWMFQTPDENRAEVDAITSAGAYVMGRNMFGPVRGDWDEDWRGWWGEEPPYHAPVFVLTHYPRDPVEMRGGTTFTFVTEGAEAALERARAVAGDRPVAVCGGAATINQYLAAGLLDELRLHIAPVVLGAGERLFAGLSGVALEQVSGRSASLVTHITYRPRR